jgi:SPP1 gp7 family putative phage head morphogenesis protein
VAGQIVAALGDVIAKADEGDEDQAREIDDLTEAERRRRRQQVEDAVDEADLSGWAVAVPELVGGITAAEAVAGSDAVATDLGLRATRDQMKTMHDRAAVWAQDRAAEMVGMRRTADGSLIPNPNARWRIDEGTREHLRGTVWSLVDSGASADEVKRQIVQAHAFSAARAETIARTEMAKAFSAGGLAGAKVLGATHKQWTTSEDDKVSEECVACGEAGPDGDGVIEVGDAFPSGEDAPPNHPNCRCAVAYLIRRESAED